MMFLAVSPEPSRVGDVLMSFLSIIFEGAPFLLIGTLLAGFIDAFLPAKLLSRVVPRNPIIGTLVAAFLGILLPVSECAIVPVIRRLLRKGLPVPVAVTYMLAAPLVNPVAAISTATAFKESLRLVQAGDFAHPILLVQHLCASAPMAVSRLSLGWLVAVLAGLLVALMKPATALRPELAAQIGQPDDAPTGGSRFVKALRTAMRDFLDTGMYFAIGVAITSFFNTQVNQALLDKVTGHEWLAIPVLMLLALLLSLSSTIDAFIVASMSSFSLSSRLAFLVFGPMMDFKLLFLYSAVFKRRIIVVLLIGLMLAVGFLAGPWAGFIQHLATLKP